MAKARKTEKFERKNMRTWKQRISAFAENTEKTPLGWIGVDLDGTLSKSVKAETAEEIGVPIHSMVQLVKVWLARGEDVRIFTARVNPNRGQVTALRAQRAIEAWCKRHLGQVLPITYEKDWDMTLLFDDKARQVERDTGKVFCRHSRDSRFAHETRRGHRGNTSQETREMSNMSSPKVAKASCGPEYRRGPGKGKV